MSHSCVESCHWPVLGRQPGASERRGHLSLGDTLSSRGVLTLPFILETGVMTDCTCHVPGVRSAFGPFSASPRVASLSSQSFVRNPRQITAQPLAPMQPQPHLPSPSPRLPVSSVTVHVSLSAETSLLQVIWRRFTWVVFSSGEKAVHLTHLLFFEWFPSFFMNSDCNCQLADRGFTYGKLAPCKFIVEFINSPIFRCLNRIFRLLLR